MRECGAPADQACGSCGTRVCREHAVARQGRVLCPECAARSSERDQEPSVAFVRRRTGYYERSGYVPVYWDPGYFDPTRDYPSVDHEAGMGEWGLSPPDADGDDLDPFES